MREKFILASFLAEIPSCKQIVLFIHAFTGCDTTSAFFNKRKLKLAKLCERNKVVQDAATNFIMPKQNEKTVFQAGVTCLLAMYGATKAEKDLNQSKYKCFIKDAAKAKKVNLAELPPSEDAANLHLKRV